MRSVRNVMSTLPSLRLQGAQHRGRAARARISSASSFGSPVDASLASPWPRSSAPYPLPVDAHPSGAQVYSAARHTRSAERAIRRGCTAVHLADTSPPRTRSRPALMDGRRRHMSGRFRHMNDHRSRTTSGAASRACLTLRTPHPGGGVRDADSPATTVAGRA